MQTGSLRHAFRDFVVNETMNVTLLGRLYVPDTSQSSSFVVISFSYQAIGSTSFELEHDLDGI